MAERSDITVDWGIFDRTSPRIIQVGSPSTALVIQDLVDTLRSNTLLAGEADDSLVNMDDEFILFAEGKLPVQPGLQTGITATLVNAKLKFEDRAGPSTILCTITQGNLVTFLEDDGSHTGADSNTVLIDSAASYITFGIETKAQDEFLVENLTDGSEALVVTVDSGIQITTDGLTGGSDNLFQAGDVIRVSGFSTSPIEPAAFTTVSYAASEAASITGLASVSALTDKIDDIHGQVRRSIYIDTSAVANGDGYQQSPYNNFTDAVDDAEANGITSLVLLDDATIDRQLKNFTIRGIGAPSVDVNNQNVDGSSFETLFLTGDIGAGSIIAVADSFLNNGLTGLEGIIFRTGFDGAITLAAASTTVMIDCFSSIGGLSRPSIDTNGGVSDISIRSYRGGLTVGGVSAAGAGVSVSMAQGKLTLDATNTAGTISVRGSCHFTDSSAGSTVDTEGLIRNQVWSFTGPFDVGSIGEFITTKLLTLGKWLGLRGGPGK